MDDKFKSALGGIPPIEHLRRQIETPSMMSDRLVPNQALLNAVTGVDLAIPRIVHLGTQKLAEFDHLMQTVNGLSHQAEALRLAIGPIDDLIKFNHEALRVSTAYTAMQAALASYAERFQIPDFGQLAISFPADACLKRIAEQFRQQDDSLRRSIEAMRTPWLDTANGLDSLTGIASLQGIGLSINAFCAYEDTLSGILRTELGDWRDTNTFTPSVFQDIAARSALYIERGFDPRLTDFPIETFAEGIEIARLGTDLPPPDAAYRRRDEAERQSSLEEDAYRRTEAAYAQLLRLEIMLRRFIDQQMTAQFGQKWIKSQTSNKTYDNWMERKRIAEQAGGPELPLICYADFTDYVPIITRRDNWKLFKPVFKREESVRESFQRLHPLRLATMHARLLTQDDELFLSVEVRRLSKAMCAGDRH